MNPRRFVSATTFSWEISRSAAAVPSSGWPRVSWKMTWIGRPSTYASIIGVLQDRGRRVALLTDGRMSGASGKVPAAIHVTPEAFSGGALGRVRDGDIIRLDCHAGVLEARVPEDLWRQRELPVMSHSKNEYGMGRELFASLRRVAGDAEAGAISLS